jgi:hypothetical protein
MSNIQEAFDAIKDLENSLKFLIIDQNHMLSNKDGSKKNVIYSNEEKSKVKLENILKNDVTAIDFKNLGIALEEAKKVINECNFKNNYHYTNPEHSIYETDRENEFNRRKNTAISEIDILMENSKVLNKEDLLLKVGICVDIFNNIAKLYMFNAKTDWNLRSVEKCAYNRKTSTCETLAKMIRGDSNFQALIVDHEGEEDSFVVKINKDIVLSWHMVRNNIDKIDSPRLEHIDSKTAQKRFGPILEEQNRKVIEKYIESKKKEMDTSKACFTGGGSYEEKQHVSEEIHEKVIDSKRGAEKDVTKIDQKMKKIQEEIEDEIVNTIDRVEITEDGINMEKEGLKAPTSTWTYLINDSPEQLGIMTITRNPFAAILMGPLIFGMAVWNRFFRYKHLDEE